MGGKQTCMKDTTVICWPIQKCKVLPQSLLNMNDISEQQRTWQIRTEGSICPVSQSLPQTSKDPTKPNPVFFQLEVKLESFFPIKCWDWNTDKHQPSSHSLKKMTLPRHRIICTSFPKEVSIGKHQNFFTLFHSGNISKSYPGFPWLS